MDNLILTEQWRIHDGQIQQRIMVDGKDWSEWQTVELPHAPMYVLQAMDPARHVLVAK